MQLHFRQLGAALFVSLGTSTFASVLYVDLNSTSPATPYTNWITAATNIQDAVDAANAGDQVLVTNGVYATGGRVAYGVLTNRVAVNKAVVLQSVNGPSVTVIQGFQVTNQNSSNMTNGAAAVRCAYLTNDARLVGFTLTNGGIWFYSADSHDKSGAGIWCEPNAAVSNCVIIGNFAFPSGGGAYQGTYDNCVIASNACYYYGGGAYNSTLKNCTLTANATISNTGSGGGAYNSTLRACLDNVAADVRRL